MGMTGDVVQYRVSGQLHDLDTLSVGKKPQYQFNERLGGPQVGLGVLEKTRLCFTCWESNLISSIVHSVA